MLINRTSSRSLRGRLQMLDEDIWEMRRVMVKVVPTPRGTGVVAGKVIKKIFEFAGIKDLYTASYGCTATTENFAKAALEALEASSGFLLPSQWEEQPRTLNPLLEFADILNGLEKSRI
jgi:small subunit ribosomal protein S2e